MALNKLKRPFIFAYSKFVNKDIEVRSKQVGFDCCINSQLGPKELNEVILTYIDTYAYKFLHQRISEQFKLDHILQLIREEKKDGQASLFESSCIDNI
jgi:hypothetical protein